MKIEKFEDIIAWKKAKELTICIYKDFKDNKDYGVRDQIQRASLSIMNNIAEGFERQSDKEFKRFLYIAKGSCGEVRSMIYLGFEIGYFTKKKTRDYYNLTIEIPKLFLGFIKSLN